MERPIIFSTPMVRAIMFGQKHMTRRLSGLERINRRPGDWIKPVFDPSDEKWVFTAEHGESEQVRLKCRFGAIGDHLWIRETFMPALLGIDDGGLDQYGYLYKSDGPEWYEAIVANMEDQRWKPSIHMPRQASRISLKITNIRIERLLEISDADCIEEGIEEEMDPLFPGERLFKFYPNKDLRDETFNTSPRTSFYSLWELIHGLGSWHLNPWVWVIGFNQIKY